MKRGLRVLVLIPVFLLIAVLFAALFGEIVMRLWNWLMPEIFGLRMITFWQALGIMVLSWILFGRGLMSGGRRFRRRRRFGGWGHGWRHVDPEERERFRQAVRSRIADL